MNTYVLKRRNLHGKDLWNNINTGSQLIRHNRSEKQKKTTLNKQDTDILG